jgi:hypothetical protein
MKINVSKLKLFVNTLKVTTDKTILLFCFFFRSSHMLHLLRFIKRNKQMSLINTTNIQICIKGY